MKLFAKTFDGFIVFYSFSILLNSKNYNVCTKVVPHTNYPTKEGILSVKYCAIHWPMDYMGMNSLRKSSVTWECMILKNKFNYIVREKSVIIEQWNTSHIATSHFSVCSRGVPTHENCNPFFSGCNCCILLLWSEDLVPTLKAKSLKNVTNGENFELNFHAHNFKSFWLLIFMPPMYHVSIYNYLNLKQFFLRKLYKTSRFLQEIKNKKC